ncbi:putative glucan endo-1,3-beta-glucosidase GVI [Elaeis guineensis]|uniref:Glucan endo-1,3-beta-glucosidase GVI n=1 Tax=Elaeis guineensis var. tenera TaxID=51953 RepID=A0A6I9R781_ELAGV|nr:putative glucan endo-1,3-beta-glucosidase GVI [Elaeis guineensis]
MSWAIAGNEVIPSNLTSYILSAMQNLDVALTATNLKINISTAIAIGVLGVSFLACQVAFSDTSSADIVGTARFLVWKRTPLLLFDAMVDAQVGHPDVSVVVLEIGWPSTGGAVGVMGENAMMYHNKVVAHVTSSTGTPKRPGMAIETYLFALFNENLKPAIVDQNYIGCIT